MNLVKLFSIVIISELSKGIKKILIKTKDDEFSLDIH